ncbi:MAG: multicopper polyphenol oxidase [Pseudomonadales bacterium]|nr:MAG: multicopper polyphenol oxidase [Pseudomonadales bacterium]
MTAKAPFHILHQDKNLLIVQTLAYTDSEGSDELAKQMLLQNTPSFGHFNLGLHVQDDSSSVLANRCHLLAQLNQFIANSNEIDNNNQTNNKNKIQQIHWLNQVHGNTVLDIDEKLESSSSKLKATDADAITSIQRGQALAIMTADCVPIVLYCPNSGRIAGIHAGWHGLANGVIANTVRYFGTLQGTTQAEKKETTQELPASLQAPLQAWIGACISVDNYEVNQGVLDELLAGSLQNFPMLNDKDNLSQKISKPHHDPNKVWIDLPSLAKEQLTSMGVQVVTDDITKIPCSYADTQFYSHRRATHKQQSSTGRMAMLVVRL